MSLQDDDIRSVFRLICDKIVCAKRILDQSAILPGKFDDGVFDAWLRKFDACCAANGWKVTEDNDGKIIKLLAFLRGRAASNFYAILAANRTSYANAVKSMRRALCPRLKAEF